MVVKLKKQKNFVLDTNVMLHDPAALSKFEDNNIILLPTVIAELDHHKVDRGEVGYCAVETSRFIESIYGSKNENVRTFEENEHIGLYGADTPEGGALLTVAIFNEDDVFNTLPSMWNIDKNDHQILAHIRFLNEQFPDREFILVSNDRYMHIKCVSLGIKVEPYKNDQVHGLDDKELYNGRKECYVLEKDFLEFMKTHSMSPSCLLDEELKPVQVMVNQYLIIRNASTNASVLSIYDGVNVLYIDKTKFAPFDITPRNASQTFLMDALLDPPEKTPLVAVAGPAGTGKTFLSLVCGLQQVMDEKIYKQVLLLRAHIPVDGEDIGALPGTEHEKIEPLFRGDFDNISKLFCNKEDNPLERQDKVEELFQRGYVDMQAVSFIRGRSIDDTFIIIDEAQNCTPNLMLTILTRCGENSKIVVLGDRYQIDHPRLNRMNNGLSFTIDRMANNKLVKICSFKESDSVRSPLAKLAAERMK